MGMIFVSVKTTEEGGAVLPRAESLAPEGLAFSLPFCPFSSVSSLLFKSRDFWLCLSI